MRRSTSSETVMRGRRVDSVNESLAGATSRWKKQLQRWIFHIAHTMSGMILVNTRGTKRFVPRKRTAAMEGAMHDSRTVANHFLRLAREKGDFLTPMQVLKLVYIAHGWMLGLYG